MNNFINICSLVLIALLQFQCAKIENDPISNHISTEELLGLVDASREGVEDAAQETAKYMMNELDEIYREDFNKLVYYGDVDVILRLDAEENGISEEDVKRIFRSSVLEHFEESDLKPLLTYGFDEEEIMGYYVEILAKGTKYPIIWNVEIHAGSFDDLDLFNDELLGISSREKVNPDVMDAIDVLVEEFAKFYFRYREN